MAGSFSKKMKNIMTFGYLMKLDKKIPQDLDKIKRKQDRNVHRLMKSAYDIPFYREKFESVGLTPDDFHSAEDLAKFPTTNRAEVRTWMEKIIAEDPEAYDKWEIFTTSGSSGDPLKFFQTARETACLNANWIRVLMFAGYKPFTGKMYSFKTSHRSLDEKKGDSWVQKLGILRRKVVPEDNCVGEGIREIINDINEYKPDLLSFRRNCLVRMALFAQRNDLEIHRPDIFVPVSEMVDDMTRTILKETFGDGLMDAYGSSETGSCIVQVPGADRYYICNDTHVVNLYDDDGHLADEGKVVITTLLKRDFPFINYDIGDRATSVTEKGVRFITSIQGRVNDFVKHESGIDSSAYFLRKIPNGITGIAQFRYIQESYHDIHVQLVRDLKNNDHTQEEIEKYFLERVDSKYGDEFNITFEWLDVIPPDENGKMRCFVCKVDQ